MNPQEQELLKKQKARIEALEKALLDKMGANENKLADLKAMYEKMPELEQLAKTGEELKRVSEQLTPLLTLLNNLDPDKLKDLMKKKA